MSAPQDFIEIARSQLGEHEDPVGSNITRYGREYGLIPASWCSQFLTSFVWKRAGLPIPEDAQSPNGWASVGFFLGSARRHGWVVTEPLPGDLACFEWGRDTWPDHIGVVVDIFADGSIHTIEGNTSGPADVGDQVTYKVRPRSQVLAFVRPPYDGGVTMPSLAPAPLAQPRVVAPYLGLSNGVLLKVGSPHHDLVGTYQKQMIKRGWNLGSSGADGIFGPITDKVTRKFQSEKHLEVDGIVGPQTWKCAFECPTS